MGNNKTDYKPVYNELIRVSNLYYSNGRVTDLLDYIAGVTGLSIILTTDGYRPAAARLSPGIHNHLFTTAGHKFHEAEPEEIFFIPDNMTAEDKVLFRIYDKPMEFKALLLPNHTHYLCIDSRLDCIDSRFEEILENALPFLALTIDREKTFSAVEFSNDFYAPFFQLLHSSSSKSPDEIRNICNMYNFNPELKRVCMTVQLQDSSDAAVEIKLLIGRLRLFLTNTRYFLICCNDFVSIFLLYPLKDLDLDIITKSYMLAASLYGDLSEQFELRIGISSAHSGIQTISGSFEESFKSIKVQKQLNLNNNASSYFEQSIYHILNIPEMEDFRKLSGDIIAPLIEYDQTNGTNFFETLQQYFYNSFNLQQTAKALYIHRNTLTYRLQHIKDLLKFDFDFEHNTDALFTLYLCICVYKLGYHNISTP